MRRSRVLRVTLAQPEDLNGRWSPWAEKNRKATHGADALVGDESSGHDIIVLMMSNLSRRSGMPATSMVAVKKKGTLWYLFRVPVYAYRWHLGWLFGKRLLLLTHTGRRTGLRRHTVLEVVEYRKEGPEVVVANGFGPDSDWIRNIQAKSDEEVKVGSHHFTAAHRFLGAEEAAAVIERYEHRNRFIAPIVRAGFSWLLGWKYRSSESERRRLVAQIPLLAFRPQTR